MATPSRQRPPTQSWEQFLIHSSDVLEAVALGKSLAEATQALVRLVEEHVHATMVTTMAADAALTSLSLVAASQTMPDDYLAMIETAPIGPFGTCARAAFDGKAVIHPVNAETEDWAAARELIDRFNFQASWSFPLYDTEATLVGTLGLYFGEFRAPSDGEAQLLERAAQLGGIILSQHRAAMAQQRSERRFHDLVESIPEGVIALDHDRRTMFASSRARELANGQEPLGRTLGELFGLLQHQERSLLAGEDLGFQLGDRWLRFRATSTAEGAVVVVRDATEERALQEQLVHADRMASVGTLAAGVAHEINNPLMAIGASLELLAMKTPLDPDAAGLLESAQVGATRIAGIANDLLSIARDPTDGEGIAEVRSSIDTALRLSGHRLRHTARVEVDVPAALPPVAMAPVHLGQVLMNLVINAAQAFENPSPSRCGIKVRAREQDGTVHLTVEDNGPGIPSEVASRVFDPFFTTKDTGEGTGLGLSITRGLVDRVGGKITLDTRPGEGSRFTVCLPSARTRRTVSSGPATSPLALHILCVDDEPALFQGAERLLRAHGHSVAYETSGELALSHLERDRSFDVLLLDMMMPSMDGPALAAAIRERHPELSDRIVFMTGGAVSARAREALSQASDRCLRKPFKVADLEQIARRLELAHA